MNLLSCDSNIVHKIIIIGSGPASLTDAIYAARAGINPSVISGDQLILTRKVENFPGFEEQILGPELMTKNEKSGREVGTKILDTFVNHVDFYSKSFKVSTYDNIETVTDNETTTDNKNGMGYKDKDKSKKTSC